MARSIEGEPSSGRAAVLEIRDLSKHYGSVVALDGATFSVRPGRLVGFLGPNGAGKTTTMRCIFGLARPDRGTITWHGRPIDRRGACASATCPSNADSTPNEGRATSSAISPSSRARRERPKAATARWLEGLGLADRARGQARDVVAWQPAARPARGGARPRPGAPRPRRAIQWPRSARDRDDVAILRDRAAAGVGVVFSSHQLDLVEDLCEDVVIINRGRIAAADSIGDLRAASHRRHLEVEIVGTATPGWPAGRTSPSSSSAATSPASSRRAGLDLAGDPGRRVGRRTGPPVLLPAADPVGSVHEMVRS